MSTRTFVAALLAVLLLAIALRALFPTADPPWRTTVGVVWHDEGAWTHNARNRALFGQWRLDAWNPIFLAPVFTGLEYASFATFGVGTWQARLVSQTAGTFAVLLLALGVTRVGGRLAGIIAGVLLATNYVYVMYDRAAIMESTMAAFIVASWYGFVRAQKQPVWGVFAAVAAFLAYFTKAAAAFWLAALALTCVWSLFEARNRDDETPNAAIWTLAGLFAAGAIALAVFVLPWWSEYRFYNWQMSVTRKPSYDLKSLIDRVSWLPVLHDVFTRMWPVFAIGAIAWIARAVRWRRLSPPERLLVLWIGVGCAELMLHDVGNERRFVFLLPAFVALAALTLARDRRLLPAEAAAWTRGRALVALPLVLYLAYMVFGPLARLAFLYEVGPSARLTGAVAVLATALLYLAWPRLMRWASASPASTWTPRLAIALTALIAAGNLVQFWQWASGRTYKNYEASRALGQILPPGTLVHGKLANGLALENRIRPVFVGRGFGNYDDRLRRDDIPYVLTYVAPREGYEGPVILDVLQAYPQRRIVWTADVAETSGGHDRAALIQKGPAAPPAGPEAPKRLRETH